MKKLLVILGIAVAVSAAGTAVYAAEGVDGKYTFQDMLPFMKEMHPNITESQLQDMHNVCHGGGGKGPSMMRPHFGTSPNAAIR